jgi:2-polyprenyl-6-methoxyphenol hydroxylase-like FAD-dependent oxidoreductase
MAMDKPLIVGAGPVGLGAGLFLARQGIESRIVEMRPEQSTQSRALAVNPRTLSILEPTGVTAKMLEMGLPIIGMQFHRQGKIVAQMPLNDVHPKFPFMLALSQATTERLLEKSLNELGGAVERNIEMTACRNVGERVEIDLQQAGGGNARTVDAPWLLAADGARSVARHQMQINFGGTTMKDIWYLADVPLKTQLAEESAHIYFFDDDAFMFMFRVVDDKRTDDPRRPVWRIMGNRPDPCSFMPQAESELMDEPLWSSHFHVSHRIDSELSKGNVYFAGDAAHIHSPMGARGMNLGLEDAYVFAGLAGKGRLAEYSGLRHPVDARVVHQVEFFSRLVSGDEWYFDFIRRHVFPHVIKTPLRSRIKQTVTGLDHDLPTGLYSEGGCCTKPRSQEKNEPAILCGSHV